jgi:hypothetical protein
MPPQKTCRCLHRCSPVQTPARIICYRNLNGQRLFGSDGPAAFWFAVAFPSRRSASSCLPSSALRPLKLNFQIVRQRDGVYSTKA